MLTFVICGFILRSYGPLYIIIIMILTGYRPLAMYVCNKWILSIILLECNVASLNIFLCDTLLCDPCLHFIHLASVDCSGLHLIYSKNQSYLACLKLIISFTVSFWWSTLVLICKLEHVSYLLMFISGTPFVVIT